jgi:Diguanylate cyclase, GGDEF domain
MRFQATHDALTSLWNRGVIMELLGRELTRSRRENKCTAILLGDLDHFKNINDTYGHLAGDEVLKETARRFGLIGTVLRLQRRRGEIASDWPLRRLRPKGRGNSPRNLSGENDSSATAKQPWSLISTVQASGASLRSILGHAFPAKPQGACRFLQCSETNGGS